MTMRMRLCFASSVILRPSAGVLCVRSISHTGSDFRPLAVPVQRRVRVVCATAAEAVPSAETESVTTITQVVETPGGYIVDATVMHRKRTKHTMVIGKEFVAELTDGDLEVPPEVVVQSVFDFFISKRHDLTNTEGMQDSGVFPINYFSLRQVFYVYPEARDYLREEFKKRTSK